MKNIKIVFLFLFQLSVLQLAFGQATDNNGRDASVTPGPVVENPQAAAPPTTNNNSGTGYYDADDPNQSQAPEPDDTFYPVDLDISNEEILASVNPAELTAKINDLNATVEDLRRICEEMRLENQIIRESLSNCCSNSSLGLSASDAYLLQNAPNPFNATAEIRYFVPAGLEDVQIKITDVKGETLNTITIDKSGYGKLDVDASKLSDGSYIYMLSVKGEVVDSKVMIITR